jgi:lipopolysaccharide transport system ATP-binding protein
MDSITVKNLNKKFRIPHQKRTTFFQNIIGLVSRQMVYEEFMVLKDINFYVKPGETLGVIGRNGSGKSTLLKMLARVLYPDSGSIATQGKVASFLELGVGFQPELSAAENVYIYASVLGMTHRETRRLYEEIFEFAELKRFENMKLKSYSSGMTLRLAFSTAIQAKPDIILIDEVLAVGDEAFQKKCIAKINEFKEQGKTIVFVSYPSVG